MSELKKYSFTLDGHRTSVALEPEFWEVLRAAASNENMSLSNLVCQIDENRGDRPLASSLRVYCLNRLRGV